MLKNLHLKEIYKKYNLYINCCIIFLLLTLSIFIPYLNIITLIYSVFCICFYWQDGLAYLIFLLPLKNIYVVGGKEVFAICILAYFILMFIKFCIEKRFKEKQNIFIMILCGVFLIYLLLPRITFALEEIARVCIIIAILAIAYIFKDKINFKSAIKAFFIGVILASLLGLLKPYITKLNELVQTDFQYEGFERFCGLDRNPNFYITILIVSFSGMLYLYLNKDISKYSICVSFVLTNLFVLLSLSKSGILAIAIILILWLITICINPSKERWIIFFISIALSVLVYVINFERFQSLFSRFFIKVDDNNYGGGFSSSGSLAESLTTGRTELWKMGLQYFIDHPIRFLFGTGTSASGRSTMLPQDCHNTFLQIIYKIGIVGLLIYLIVFIAFMWYYIKNNKLKFYYFIPGAMLVWQIMFLDYFSLVTLGFLIIVACVPIVLSEKKSNEEKNKKEGFNDINNYSGV